MAVAALQASRGLSGLPPASHPRESEPKPSALSKIDPLNAHNGSIPAYFLPAALRADSRRILPILTILLHAVQLRKAAVHS